MAIIPKFRKQFATWAAVEFHPAAVANSLFASVLIYIIELIISVSFSALIFSGSLAGQVPRALGFILVGNILILGITSLLSSYAGSIAVSQDAPGVVLSVGAASIVAALPLLPVEKQFATVVLMIAITTVMTGLIFLVLGIFKLGGLARFLPYPVMGGFLAGTGWLLAKGGIGIMVSNPFGPEWFEPQVLLHWLPGFIFGLFIFAVVSFSRWPLTLPVMLFGGSLVFYIVAGILNVSQSQLETQGWLVGSVSPGSLSNMALSGDILAQVNWEVLWGTLPNLSLAVIISVIALLLNCAGLELVSKKDIGLNRELITLGSANILAGAFGGIIGYHAISLSALNHKLSGGKRLAGLVTTLLLIATFFLGASILGYIPKMILGAVLVFLGVGLLVEWVYESWFKFPRIDFAIIVSILVIIIFSGLINGIIFGLVLAVGLFVISYSRLNTVKYQLSGSEYHSRVTRSWQQQQLLEAQSSRVSLFKLQGFIFFGTANTLFNQVRELFQNKSAINTRFVILDFTFVNGLDSTGLLSFARILQWGQKHNIVLIFTGLGESLKAQFNRGGFQEQPDRLYFFTNLDLGIEWCENQLLPTTPAVDLANNALVSGLKAIVGGDAGVEKLLSFMTRREYQEGEHLIRQGDSPDTIYFIESGEVTAQWENSGQDPVRLEKMGGGRLVGELGYYLNIKRTASVIVNAPSVIYSFSRQGLAQVEKDAPEITNLFHRIVAHMLSERVVHLLHVVETLER